MQPYFFPYIGYFQLINAVNEFVIYDNIEFSKKGWINRNRILVNNNFEFITLPLKKDSDFLHINKRFLADSWKRDRQKLLNRINASYRKAPYFDSTFNLIDKCFKYENNNLFNFIFNSILELLHYLNIDTKITLSSSIPFIENLKKTEKIIAISKFLEYNEYINPIGGFNLYKKNDFKENNIILNFLESDTIVYRQFDNNFISSLSIIDVMMFNNLEEIKQYFTRYTLL